MISLLLVRRPAISARIIGPVPNFSLLRGLVLAALVLAFGGGVTRAVNCPTAQVVNIPINSPPVPYTVAFGDPEYSWILNGSFSSFNVSSAQSWATITGVQPYYVGTPGPAGEIVSVLFNVAGFPIGEYCAIFSDYGTAVGTSNYSPHDCAPGSPPCCFGLFVLVGSVCVGTQPVTGQILVAVNVTASAGNPYLADPVPSLLSGNAVISNPLEVVQLISSARTVSGVAADGVTEAVIAAPISPSLCNCIQPGDQVQFTVFNDGNGPSSLPNEDGALGALGATSFSQSQVTATAVNPGSSMLPYYAFAVYRAPVDFARQTSTGYKTGTCQGTTNFDDTLACRTVSVHITDVTAGVTIGTVTIAIVRPPLILIHGICGSADDWNTFQPLVKGPKGGDSRFSIGRYNFDYNVDNEISITSSSPTYPQTQSGVTANSLGFQYNAAKSYAFMWDWIKNFRQGQSTFSPTGLSVASVQADVIGHSMGGDIARTIANLSQFSNDPDPAKATFGQGNIHKLITIDTPHLGTPLASSLLNSANSCTREFLANNAYNFSFVYVKQNGNTNSTCGTVTNAACGAVGDLIPSSPALNAINNVSQSQPHYLPTAFVAGIYTNFASLNCQFCVVGALRAAAGCPNDPLTQSLTSDGWSGNFGVVGSNENDAIVGLSSQLNTPTPNPSSGFQFTGYVHSPGTKQLDFTGPTVLDPNVVAPQTVSIPTQVINLLNTPVTNQTSFVPTNP
jgi:pimeloyl-ACP methyl ester carboxylesterase